MHLLSTDEKTGIQAIERDAPALPMRPGQVEKPEFNYDRHGTQCLTANFEVATGAIVTPTVGPTRTEKDFAAHIERTVQSDPNGTWLFVLDPLNTHMSATLILLVALRCGITGDLGEKGK
ncbi:MAG: transposase, partial [Planctomycetota bacterium]|nr:transposase [Planctomycetota bacterium]